jgi:hypothetical protein
MGRKRAFANGLKAKAFDFSELREPFYSLLTHRSIQQIDAYWARIIFSGQGMPPVKLSSAQLVLSAVQKNQAVFVIAVTGLSIFVITTISARTAKLVNITDQKYRPSDSCNN